MGIWNNFYQYYRNTLIRTSFGEWWVKILTCKYEIGLSELVVCYSLHILTTLNIL